MEVSFELLLQGALWRCVDQHMLVFMLNRVKTVSLRDYLELLNKGRRRVDVMYLTAEGIFL